ncbi:MAG: general secretion pathway protein GspK [Desulfobacterales bacterium]
MMRHDLKKLRPVNNQRGMALLITLAVTTLLVTATVELNRQARATIFSSAAVRDRHRLSEMVASGVNAAMAMLVEDKKNTTVDSLQEDWADPAKVNSVLETLAFDGGTLEVKISDERSRIQVNALVKFPEGREFNEKQRQLWERLLKLAFLAYEHPDETDPVNTIINSLKDWLDSGDDDAITGLSGAESDYYRDLDPPVAIRNGPFTLLKELLPVKGITPELFYGTSEVPGLAPYLTVGGMTDDGGNFTFTGKININTAEMPVLAALLPEENQDLALPISEFRLEKTSETFNHDLSGANWYKQVPGAGDIEFDSNLITTQSDLFRIEAAASLNGVSLTATVVVHRETEPETGQIVCRVLSWEQN